LGFSIQLMIEPDPRTFNNEGSKGRPKMSVVLSCKTKDKELESKLRQYARANGLSKSKAIEDLLRKALKIEQNGGSTEEYQRHRQGAGGIVCLLSRMEAEIRQLRQILKEEEDV